MISMRVELNSVRSFFLLEVVQQSHIFIAVISADTGALSDEDNEGSGNEDLPSIGSDSDDDEDEEEEETEDSDDERITEDRLARNYVKPGARDRQQKKNKW